MINTPYRFSHHCRERLQQNHLSSRALADAIGSRWTTESGVLKCRLATDGPARFGDPVIVGRGSNKYHRTVTLLVTTGDGRQLHCAGQVIAPHTLKLITMWDPNTPLNRPLWRPDLLIPTAAGARTLPTQHWIVGDPFNRRGFAPSRVDRTRKDHS